MIKLQPSLIIRTGLGNGTPLFGSRSTLATLVSYSNRTLSTSTRSNAETNSNKGSSSTSHRGRGGSGMMILTIGAIAGACVCLPLAELLTEDSQKGSSSGVLQKLISGTNTSKFGKPNLEGYLNTLRKNADFKEDQISFEESELESHGHSPWSYHPARNPSAVIYPTTIEQVQELVKQAAKHGIVLTPFAGGTSLEAHWAAPPDHPGLHRKVVSVDFNLMDKIGECNVADGDIEVEAGVKYEDLNQHLQDQGIDLFFPVDPGPGAALGGMMGTGGSGTNAVRYGTMRGDYVINATVVLPNGEVITTRSRSRKSSVGPDLTKIFLGAEGTMGLVVKARLRLAPLLPTSIVVVPFGSIHDACSAAQQIVQGGVGVQCIELLDDEMIRVINTANEKSAGTSEYKKHIVQPSLFIKLQGNATHRKEDERVIRQISKTLGVKDRQIESSHEVEANERLWRARKIALWSCLEAMPTRPEWKDNDQGKNGYKVWTTDVSVPLGSMADLFTKVRKDTQETGLHAPIIGHIGDGGAHSIIVFKDEDEEEMKKVKAFVHRIVEYAHEMEGTCTSEHGIGRGKRMYLERELGKGTVALLRTLKNAIDPHNIMNPGSLLYETDQERREELEELQALSNHN